MRPDRRRFLILSGGLTVSAAFPALPRAENPSGIELHGLSAFGDLKYPRGFSHFDYASPEAPDGGTFNFQPGYWYFNQNVQTFNTLNSFVRRGDAPPRMEYCFDALTVSAWDEPDAVYCHLAESVTISDDRNRFTFRLRPEARWHDGSPVTAHDVAFSYETLKAQGNPELSLPLSVLKEAVAEDEETVTLVFDGTQSAQAILAIAGYPVLNERWYANRPFDAATLEPPLGSGPYRVGKFSAGSYIEYERVDDYWAKDLGTARGLDHFRTIRIEFYKERQAAFEAFKKGAITWRQEFTSKSWATEYGFPAVQDGRVVQRLFPRETRPSMQALAPNQRRAQFRDRRVRDAIALCFDFDWTNKNLFHGAYEKSHSLFAGSDYETSGPPDTDELALIGKLSAEHAIPEGIEGDAYREPPSDGSGRDRRRLRAAIGLLDAAGWKNDGGVLRNSDGETLDAEILIRSSVFERIYNPWVETMRALGINASLRLVDPAQFQERTNSFDFDIAGFALSWTATPTRSGLEGVLGSKAAQEEGSKNWTGTADPLIDAIIAEVGAARTRAEHRTAMRVLDRVLRLRRDWIPNWTSANHRVAYWDMYGFKEPKPDYFWPVERLWWTDRAKAEALGKA
ncbi:extracellular solute-binding protein [Oricola thermophila]|uniref:ABC transporter substrate-binding protein n=1 Tax=Oricola thermophila TaxID=2742145 RepID=A0A6N1VKI0_9HYPH|nr:extracellular solute-binding protein [Oricola thermophila]QKV19457.1 ABC transporter substrate-binding protein [Oricola thermophila]